VLARRKTKRRLGWTLIGLAPLALAAAAVVVVFSGLLTASAGQVLTARLLATAAAVMFASGCGLVMSGRLRPTDHPIVVGLTRITVSATTAAALITGAQLLFVNNTVGTGIRLALWALVGTAVITTAMLPWRAGSRQGSSPFEVPACYANPTALA
jgi:hypothetical protein